MKNLSPYLEAVNENLIKVALEEYNIKG